MHGKDYIKRKYNFLLQFELFYYFCEYTVPNINTGPITVFVS